MIVRRTTAFISTDGGDSGRHPDERVGGAGDATRDQAPGGRRSVFWQIFNTGSPNTLTTVDVVNPKVIWAVGGGFAGAVNDGTVLRTLNGGQTWENVTPPDGTDPGLP